MGLCLRRPSQLLVPNHSHTPCTTVTSRISSHWTRHTPRMLNREHVVALCSLLLRLHNVSGIQIFAFSSKHAGHFISDDGTGIRLPTLHTDAMELYSGNNQLLSLPSQLTYIPEFQQSHAASDTFSVQLKLILSHTVRHF